MSDIIREDRSLRPKRSGGIALTPILFLAFLMLLLGILSGDFYKVPMTIVFLLTSIMSLFVMRGYSIDERINTFSQGAGAPQLLLMIWIFALAGAFARSAESMGAVNAIVDLTVMSLPPSILLAGLFLASCIVSLCIGTSVGTIVALVPVASSLAVRMDMNLPMTVAVVVGGSFFGDNLSFISDTTVAATRTQGCSMRDKFRTNFHIVWPAALVCFLIYVVIGFSSSVSSGQSVTDMHLLRILPYLVVLVTALLGMNVLVVLCIGCLLTGVVGIFEGSYTLFGWLAAMAKGIADMGELILISMMAGGLLAVVRKGGGVTWLVRGLTRRVSSRKGAEGCISLLVALTNCCTANNTVAILSVGSIAKDVSERYGVSKQRAASLLDIFSCVTQGVLPYGAQLLMAAGLAVVSPMQIIPYLYYPVLLAIAAVISILFSSRLRKKKRAE